MRAAMKLLVVTPEPIDAAALRSAAGPGAEEAEVLVVTPATHQSGLRFWMSDADEAIADADEAGTEIVTQLRDEGVAANSTTGESEPLMALQDALATFPADRIVIFVRERDDQRYREDDVCGEVQRRFDVPVTLATL